MHVEDLFTAEELKTSTTYNAACAAHRSNVSTTEHPGVGAEPGGGATEFGGGAPAAAGPRVVGIATRPGDA